MNLYELTIEEAAGLLKDRKISSVELTRAVLDRNHYVYTRAIADAMTGAMPIAIEYDGILYLRLRFFACVVFPTPDEPSRQYVRPGSSRSRSAFKPKS